MINPYDPSSAPDSDGDRAAEFMELLAARQGQIFGYIFAIISNATDAQDVYQQTVMALWRKFDEFEKDSNFTAWALKVAYYEVQMYRRANSRSKLLFSDDLVAMLSDSQLEATAGLEESGDRLANLQHCLSKLKGADRELVRMSYEERTPVLEMAKLLKRSSQSICNSLRRIRMALLKCVDSQQARNGA
ncbi:sigma-70 family RNA polymerase sigma factor [Aeoliella mucimassa]|uniref:RNA polymerase sigma factor CnrH n=1 Tax=Aeoliella mucimassa TaxID=2527972 RepID=A0A518AK26_9BACT|nr:sigma-70 family RNA polymerase sigma factor [Aeoliella mucimassa]QDU55079.1 RNA polymerase sigma factor CnrH [Aeoliella mucimassa]